jgi:molybdopterin biosynthesis enzyme
MYSEAKRLPTQLKMISEGKLKRYRRPGTIDCSTLLQEMMHTDLVAVVLVPHLKQLALDGTALFASPHFENNSDQYLG